LNSQASPEAQIAASIQTVNQFVEDYFARLILPASAALQEQKEALRYSATNGGKRFRPVLCLLVAQLFDCPAERTLPFAVAVEFVHTYSLIHDDLPCMDNDDIRRGQPTNHKIYGEAFALLAGDALLTEAFLLIAEAYASEPAVATQLTRLLAQAASVRGMVGGQAIDLKAGERKFTLEELAQLHAMKTGALIQVCVEGAALLGKAQPAQSLALKKFGQGLGLAFQVADDILDHGEKDQDSRSFTGILGLAGTQKYLQEISTETLGHLRQGALTAPNLEHLIHFNKTRTI